MERITLMSLLLTAVVSSSPRQYHFVNQNMTWTEAQSHCRDKYTDLVTINDIQEQNYIKELIKQKSSANRVWIGLKNAKVGVWSDPNVYRANESQYRNWKPGQPNGDGDCVFMYYDNTQKGKWHDVDCSTTRHFICYNASSKGFVLEGDQKNWTDAQKYCRQYHTDLASVRNETENEQIASIINNNPPSPNEAWIGLYRLWVWSDNSTSTFTNWQPGSAKIYQNCTVIDISDEGRWTDEDCANQRPFVCHDDKLVLIRENKTWTEALRYCRNISMDLVSVDSDQMQQRVMNVTASASSAHVWLGLRHSCPLRLWFWVSSYIICYDQWAFDYDIGLDNCDKTVRSGAIRTRDQLWISRPETEEYNFICIK